MTTKEKKLIWVARQTAHKYWPFLQKAAGRRSKVKVKSQTSQSRNQSRRTRTNFTLKLGAIRAAFSGTSGKKCFNKTVKDSWPSQANLTPIKQTIQIYFYSYKLCATLHLTPIQCISNTTPGLIKSNSL